MIVGACLLASIFMGAGDGPATPVSLSNGAGQPMVALRLRFEPGQEAVYHVVAQKSIRSDSKKKEDADKNMESTVEYWLHRRIASVSPDESALMKFTFRRLRSSGTGPDGPYQFDTASPVATDETKDRVQLREMVGQSFQVTMTSRGQVTNLRGLADPQLSSDPKAPGPGLARLAGASELMNVFRSQHTWIPEQPIAIGQPWTRTEDLPTPLLTLRRTNQLVASVTPERRLRIESRIEISAQAGPANEVQQKNGVVGELLPSPPGSATIVFNPATGMLESLDAHVEFQIRYRWSDKPRKETSETQVVSARTQVRLLPSNEPGPDREPLKANE